MQRCLLVAAMLFVACDRPSSRNSSAATATCGLAALAGPTALLGQFSVEGQTLDSPPRKLPERLVVRLVAGPAYPAIVGRSDSLLVIGVNGGFPGDVEPRFGVLTLAPSSKGPGV